MNILDFIFPKHCVSCSRVGRYFCEQCRKQIRLVAQNEAICPVCGRLAIDGVTHPKCQTRYSLDGLTSFFHYDGPVRAAIKSLKYRHVSDLAAEFFSLISQSHLDYVTKRRSNDLLIPIPLHLYRHKERGYNQAEVLGKLIAYELHIPIRTDVLERIRQTEPQVAMKDRKTRLTNMQNVFGVQKIVSDVHGKSVVLFDDVFTTGATMRSAANILKRAGVKRVWAVTMAR